MEFKICLFRKSFRGGENREYVLLEKDADVNEAMESWGESSDGGHSYGYTVYCEETIYKPTKEIINHFIKKINSKIKYLEESIEFNKTKLESLTIMTTRRLPKKQREVYERIKNGEQLFEHGEFGPDGKRIFKFVNGDEVDPKIISYLLDRCYIKKTNYEIDYVGNKNFKYEIVINI